MDSTSLIYLGASAVGVGLIAVVTAVWFAVRFAALACWRLIRTQMTVRRGMRGFDRNLQRILTPHPSERGNNHYPPDNKTDST